MGDKTGISWCHHTFNGWIGCSRISPGCRSCYADTQTQRWQPGNDLWRRNGTRRVTSDANWRKPLQWNRAAQEAGERRRVFASSLADVFEDRRDLDETNRAIPTLYNGVLHRSRTEAKWARFMDFLSIPAKFEIEGWDTDGEWYLPDFVIFGALGATWAEVKPAYDADPAGVARFRRFAAQRPQPSRAALIIGEPGDYSVIVTGGDQGSESAQEGPWEDEGYEWRPCGSGHHFDFAYAGTFRAKFAEDGCPDDFGGTGEQRIKDAEDSARSFRFERPKGGAE